jgi:hypothetical protein
MHSQTFLGVIYPRLLTLVPYLCLCHADVPSEHGEIRRHHKANATSFPSTIVSV